VKGEICFYLVCRDGEHSSLQWRFERFCVEGGDCGQLMFLVSPRMGADGLGQLMEFGDFLSQDYNQLRITEAIRCTIEWV